jgi:CBS domain-containing protein
MDVATLLMQKGRDVAIVRSSDRIASVVAELHRKKIGAVVVSDDGRTVEGILSERDIVRGLAERGTAILDRTAADVMTRPVYTCGPSDRIERLMGQMTDHRVRHLPVVEDGALCGIVSIGDVVKNRLEEIESEAAALRDYVARG